MKALLKLLAAGAMVGGGAFTADWIYDRWINDLLPANLQYNNLDNVGKGKFWDDAIYWGFMGTAEIPIVVLAAKLFKQKSPIAKDVSPIK